MLDSRRGFSLVEVAVGLVVLSMVSIVILQIVQNKDTNSSKTAAAAQGEIIYLKNHDLYRYNLQTEQKDLLKTSLVPNEEPQPDIGNLVLSPDHKWLYFGDGYEDIYRYNFESREAVHMGSFDFNPQIEWFSPSGQFLVIDTGCCPGNRGRHVFNAEKGELIESLSGANLVWSTQDTYFGMEIGEVALDILPYGPAPMNTSIYGYQIVDNKLIPKRMLEGSRKESYQLEFFINDHELVYKKLTYSEAFPKYEESAADSIDLAYWENVYSNPLDTYGKIDIGSLQITEISIEEYQSLQSSARAGWEDLMARSVLSSDGKQKVVINDVNGVNKVVIVEGESENVKNTIDVGDGAVWRYR
jgi:prepilin-type N-terminal cleavage/methylation domain-containing protein